MHSSNEILFYLTSEVLRERGNQKQKLIASDYTCRCGCCSTRRGTSACHSRHNRSCSNDYTRRCQIGVWCCCTYRLNISK